jgi:hypothetical protein
VSEEHPVDRPAERRHNVVVKANLERLAPPRIHGEALRKPRRQQRDHRVDLLTGGAQ